MAGKHPAPRTVHSPFTPQGGKIGDPYGEARDGPGHRIRAEPSRAGLTAPVGSGHPPTLDAPVLERFEVFLVGVSASRHEQQRATHRLDRLTPVDSPDPMAIRGRPETFDGARRDGATVEGVRRGYLANFDLPPVVTLW